MTNIIKRIISKRSKIRTYEYTGDTESIPKTITHVQFHPSVTEVHVEAFKGCSKLKEIVFSDGITKIGNGSFKGCTKLKRVVFTNGLKQIGDDAFSGCTSLDSIAFPYMVTKIGDRAFKDCNTLKHIINTRIDLSIPKEGWDVFHGCPLAVIEFRLAKIIEISHLKEVDNKINGMDDSAIQLRDHNLILNMPLTDSAIKSLYKISNLIQYYEVKEATSLVELALWKATKIDQATEEDCPIDYDTCRVEVPGPAKNLILQYAYTIPLHTTTSYPIYIKSSRGVEPRLFRVEPSDTIADFKNKIYDDKGIAIDQQQFFFNGSELLNDDRTLSDYNIVRDSIIICFEISGD